MGKYNAIDIARYIVKKCDEDNKKVTNLHLQKLLFFIQKESLKETENELFNNEMEAWQYGPVVPDVYYKYSGFGAMPIEFYDFFEEVPLIQDKDKALIDNVINSKIDKGSWELVNETHVKGGAWDKVSDEKGYFATITVSDIKKEIDSGL